MVVVLIISGILALIAFVYVVATERNNKIVNTIMVVFGIILPSFFIGTVLNALWMDFKGAYIPVIWWVDIIVAVVDVFLILYLIFVSGEKLEDVFDDYGNKIGQRGGSFGIAFVAMAATIYLLGQFAPLCESWLLPLVGVLSGM